MKRIQPSNNEHHWPRHRCDTVECRKRDLVLRISDWSRDREEPAFDVEVYIGGVYDWNESETLTKRVYGTMRAAKSAAMEFSQKQISKLL